MTQELYINLAKHAISNKNSENLAKTLNELKAQKSIQDLPQYKCKNDPEFTDAIIADALNDYDLLQYSDNPKYVLLQMVESKKYILLYSSDDKHYLLDLTKSKLYTSENPSQHFTQLLAQYYGQKVAQYYVLKQNRPKKRIKT